MNINPFKRTKKYDIPNIESVKEKALKGDILSDSETNTLKIYNMLYDRFLTGMERTPEGKYVILNQVENDYSYRQKQNITSWRNAINSAENYLNRYDLWNLFQEIDLDSYVQSVVDLRKSKVTGTPFITYLNDNVDDEQQKFFDSKWFYEFIDQSMDSIFEGFTLMQLIIDAESKIKIQKIPLKYVVPELAIFKKNPNIFDVKDGIKYNENPNYEPYMIEVFQNRKDLGLYTKIAPLFLWSKSAKVSWSEFVEVFGLPIKHIQTATKDPKELNKLSKMLQGMGRSLGLITNNNDQLNLIETTNTDSYNTFNEFIKLCNNEIAQLVLGGSMITSDGSSYSQSQVHDKQFTAITKNDIRNMEYTINDVLIPKLVKLGMVKEGTWIKFDLSENLSIQEKFAIDKELMPYYELDQEYLNEEYNTKIIGTKNIFNVDDTSSNI